MKKILPGIIITGAMIWAGAYIFYRFYLPDVVAKAIVSENKLPSYVPKRILNRIEEIRGPVNHGTEDLIKKMDQENIPMEKIFEVIDQTSEEEAYQLLDELNATKIKDPNEVFDIAKKHIHTEFDVEVFRPAFNKNVDVKLIKRTLAYAKANRKTKDVDIQTIKAILKQVLLEKRKEVKR